MWGNVTAPPVGVADLMHDILSPTNAKLSLHHNSCSIWQQHLGSGGQKNLIFSRETTDNRSGLVWAARLEDNS